MLCILLVIFQTLAVVVEGGSSGSGEAVAIAGVQNNGAAAGNNANPIAPNGVQLNVDALLAQLLKVGGPILIQPLRNPIGQQLIPIGALQQGGPYLVGANLNPQGQVAQAARGGQFIVFPMQPQINNRGIPQGAMLTPGQMQLLTAAGLNNQQQPGAAGGRAIGSLRFQRSVAARLRRTQSSVMKVDAGIGKLLQTQLLLQAMNQGMLGGLNGGLGNPGMMNAGLNAGLNQQLMANLIRQPQLAQPVGGLPAGMGALPNGFAIPANAIPLQQALMQRLRRHAMRQENILRATVDTQIPAPTEMKTPIDNGLNGMN
ncbi:hypothetical protein NQZ68_039075 [Scomber scombrus]|uniref:Uncharacterized protein n=1 Tax=Scomber scombrus TaxID=13677 RepID=A0AAV1NH11_SCOSC